MEFLTIALIVGLAIVVVFFGSIISHSLKFVFYALLVLLAVVFIFGISFTDAIGFIRGLVFTVF